MRLRDGPAPGQRRYPAREEPPRIPGAESGQVPRALQKGLRIHSPDAALQREPTDRFSQQAAWNYRKGGTEKTRARRRHELPMQRGQSYHSNNAARKFLPPQIFRPTVALDTGRFPESSCPVLHKAARLWLIAVDREVPIVFSQCLGKDMTAFVAGSEEEAVGCLTWIPGRLDGSQPRAGDRTRR